MEEQSGKRLHEREKSAFTFLIHRAGGKDGTRREERVRKEGWRGEGNSQRRGNGDRSIRAKTTGLL